MTDAHIHIESGPYTLEWIKEYVKVAVSRGIDEIYLLEHCYRFHEFVPMYEEICAASQYIDKWFHRKAGVLFLKDYLDLIEQVRSKTFPICIKFGLEVCYFPEHEKFVKETAYGKGLDFLLGSVHFVDKFAFDHKAEHWQGIDVDKLYKHYFELSVQLAESGIYTGIAHPDSIKLFGYMPTFSLLPYYEKLAKALKKSGMYAEQSSGITRRTGCELGMDKAMLAIMKQHGVKILTASDAHRPEDTGFFIDELQQTL